MAEELSVSIFIPMTVLVHAGAASRAGGGFANFKCLSVYLSCYTPLAALPWHTSLLSKCFSQNHILEFYPKIVSWPISIPFLLFLSLRKSFLCFLYHSKVNYHLALLSSLRKLIFHASYPILFKFLLCLTKQILNITKLCQSRLTYFFFFRISLHE